MARNVTELLPIGAVAAFVLFSIYTLAKEPTKDGQRQKNSWLFPAALSLLFMLFSLIAAVSGGVLGFWGEHTRNSWGNQIWFDLLLAIGIGWYLIVPQAKALGMRPLPWLTLIVCTGCIGFLNNPTKSCGFRMRKIPLKLAVSSTVSQRSIP